MLTDFYGKSFIHLKLYGHSYKTNFNQKFQHLVNTFEYFLNLENHNSLLNQ